jgi:hypothetical protein
MSIRTKVRMVKSNASSVQAVKVVRNVCHCWRVTWRYQGASAGARDGVRSAGGEVMSGLQCIG